MPKGYGIMGTFYKFKKKRNIQTNIIDEYITVDQLILAYYALICPRWLKLRVRDYFSGNHMIFPNKI